MKKCGCPNHGMIDKQMHACSRKASHSRTKGCKCRCGKRWVYGEESHAVEIKKKGKR